MERKSYEEVGFVRKVINSIGIRVVLIVLGILTIVLIAGMVIFKADWINNLLSKVLTYAATLGKAKAKWWFLYQPKVPKKVI